MSIFMKNGHFCVVQKNPVEIPEQYTHRGYAIISKKPTTQEEFDKYVTLSNYLNNIKFLGCTYVDSINDACKEMDENMTSN